MLRQLLQQLFNKGTIPRRIHQKPLRGFWQTLINEKLTHGQTLTVLAPMADVTDIAFRTLLAKYGKPDVTWTEFVSADGLNEERCLSGI
jgi:hypothetical protein